MSIVAGLFGLLPIMFAFWPAINWSQSEFYVLFGGGIFIIVLGIFSSIFYFDNFSFNLKRQNSPSNKPNITSATDRMEG